MCISRIEFIILELSINNKLNNEHKVKKSERGKRSYRMRKTRSDCRVGTFEKKNGLPPGTVKKPKTPSPSIPGSAAAVAVTIASSLIVSNTINKWGVQL